jgi:FAD/FMN-containing dehydrogenase
LLCYAPAEHLLAVVLYLNQSTDADGNGHMASLTQRLIDLCLQVGGRFFLPYQVHYTAEQLERSYPEIRQFLAARAEFDRDGLLTNTFVERIQSMLTAGGAPPR